MTENRVGRLLGAPELRGLIDALVRRLERGQPLVGVITLSVDKEERETIAAIFGLPSRIAATMIVDLDRLNEIVREAGAASSLRSAVERLRGPIVVRHEAAERERRAWDAAFEPLETLVAARPELAGWATSVRSRGIVRRLAGTPGECLRLLERIAIVLVALPADGEALARLAVRLLGSAHALDAGTPEATLVLSALGGGARTRGARARRERWASAGVALDELSSTVLVHRLPLSGPLGELTHAGEPVVLTLRQLSGLVVPIPQRPVFVCENPSVVDAAAREFADDGLPLVCVEGQPSLAADALLQQIAGAGLRYHGDFDWGGIRIANRLYQRFGFDPWQYRSSDLERAADLPGATLKGAPVEAGWDARLRPALERRGTRLEEEQVLGALLADLTV